MLSLFCLHYFLFNVLYRNTLLIAISGFNLGPNSVKVFNRWLGFYLQNIYYFCVYLIGDIFSRWACVVQVWNIILLNKHLFGDFLDLLNLRVTFGLLGKFLITISLDVIYVWTVELYPTQIRYVLLCFSFFTYLM